MPVQPTLNNEHPFTCINCNVQPSNSTAAAEAAAIAAAAVAAAIAAAIAAAAVAAAATSCLYVCHLFAYSATQQSLSPICKNMNLRQSAQSTATKQKQQIARSRNCQLS